MTKPQLLAVARIGFGVLGLIAIIAQLLTSIELDRSISNFFSFFTIQSNILVALLLLVVGICNIKGITRNIASLRGALTLYIAMTGIIYFLLLSGNEAALQTTIPWVNAVLHYIIPVVAILDWILFPPVHNVSFRQASIWLIYPVVYVVYSLIRGAFTEWYPYPFLNPIATGWPNIVGMCLIIGIATIGLSWLITLRTPKPPRER